MLSYLECGTGASGSPSDAFQTNALARGFALHPPSSNSPSAHAEPPERPSGALAAPIARELRGDLPCVRCKYNLKGLTVKGMCPECGTSVRTTLLAVVDPLAKELRPIRHPALTGLGMVVWATSALLAVLCVWFLRAEDFLSRPRGGSPALWLAYGVVALAAISGLAAIVLINPHDGIPRRQRYAALLGVLAYIPLCVFLFFLHVSWDTSNRPPYGYQSEIRAERFVLRLCISLLLVAILLLLRPNARLLSGRWVLMRLGAVDRQTMFTISLVIALWSLGDLLRFSFTLFQGTLADVLRFAGTSSVVVGSLLFTVGLASLVLECWRLRPIIAQPPLDLEELTSHREPATPQAASTIPAR